MMQIISSLPYASQRQLARRQRLTMSWRFILLAAFMSLSFLLLLSLLSGRGLTDPMVNIIGGPVQISSPGMPNGNADTPPK